MRLKLTAPSDRKEQLLEMVDSYDAVVESVDQAGANTSVVAQVGGGVERGHNHSVHHHQHQLHDSGLYTGGRLRENTPSQSGAPPTSPPEG